MNILFVVIAILIFILTTYLSFLLVSSINIKKAMKIGIEKLTNAYNDKKAYINVKMYNYNITQKMSWPEKIDLYLISKSNIKAYIPFFNFPILVFLCCIIFCLVFIPVYRLIYSFLSTIIISGIIACSPFYLLDLLSRYNSDKVRRMLSEFISVLNRWCAVKEDIIFAFEKSINSIGEPLRTYISELVTQIHHGMDRIEALDILELKVDNPQFKDFIINIKQNLKSRGNIVELLNAIEQQFYKIDQEYNARKISTLNDRIVIYATMVFVVIIAYFFLKTNESVRAFYLATPQGKVLMSFFSILFALSIYVTSRITKFDY